MIKLFFVVWLLLSASLEADLIKVKTLACKTLDALQKAPVDKDDYLNLNMYAIAHDCVILSRDAKVQVLGYDPRNSQDMFVQIVEKKTGYTFFMLKSKVQIEQGGKKANYRF